MIKFSESAINDLKKIDKQSQLRILNKIEELNAHSNPMQFAKPIKSAFPNIYRFRVGGYRLIFENNGAEYLLVIIIDKRNDVYKRLDSKLKNRL